MKKGQIAVFAIIGLVLLVSGMLYLWISKDSSEKLLGTNVNTASKSKMDETTLHQIAETCLKDRSEDGLILIGKQGGYLFPVSEGVSTRFFENNWLVYLIDGNERMLTFPIMKIANDLSLWIRGNINECMQDLAQNAGMDVELPDSEEMKITTVISERGGVFIKMDYPIKIAGINSDANIDTISVDIPVRLFYIYHGVDMILDEPNSIIEAAGRYIPDLGVKWKEPLPGDLPNEIIEVIDESSKIKNKPYAFMFGVKK